MKISLLSENLQKNLLLLNRAISSRSQLPVLLNFLIEARGKGVFFSATDLEIGITIQIPAKVEKEGTTTVPARTFSELLGTLVLEKIILEKKQEGLELLGEKVRTVFQTMPQEDFPRLFKKKGGETMVLKKEDVEKDFSQVVFAASQDVGRPVLSGVLIKEGGKGELFLVATDGFRLSLKRNALKSLKKEIGHRQTAFIVPSRVIREFILMSKEVGGEEIRIYIPEESNQILFCQNDATLVGRLIEGDFPQFEKIIPQDFSTRALFEKEDLEKAVKACYIFARETAGIVKLSLGKGKIVVSANAPSLGKNTIEVGAKTEGEENEIAFNARYLLDLFSHVGKSSLIFEMTGPLNPGVFKIQGERDYLHLIMPIRVQSEA